MLAALFVPPGCASSGGSADLGDVTGADDAGPATSTGSTTATGDTTFGNGTSGGSSNSSGGADGTSDGGTTVGAVDSSGGPVICGGDRPGPLELGHGYKSFRPLREGPAELIHGPQGGVHITLGVRCPGLDVSQFGDVQLVGTVNGQVVADHPQGAVLKCNEALDVAEGIWLSMIFEVGPEALHGQMIDLEVTLTDDVGHTVSAQGQTSIYDPELGGTSDSGGSGSSGTSG